MRNFRRFRLGAFAVVAVLGCPVEASELTAQQIVEKNISVRGGIDAWQKIQTMIWVGHIESVKVAQALPFALEIKRPNKTRFEIRAQNQVSVRVYDGAHGWKLHPSLKGPPSVQPYSAEELSAARDGQGMEMPFLDARAKGFAAKLDGIEEIEGHRAYRLAVTLPSGTVRHVWIDAESFLDVKYERPSRNGGQSGMVPVFYRNYRTVSGVQMPFAIETGAGIGKDKMVIDRILLNPPLDDRMFDRPDSPARHDGAAVRVESQRTAPQEFGSQSAAPLHALPGTGDKP